MKILDIAPRELANKIASIRKKMELETTTAPIPIYRKKIRDHSDLPIKQPL